MRLALLLGGILAAGGALLATAVLVGLPAGRDTFAFMAAEVTSLGYIVCPIRLWTSDASLPGLAHTLTAYSICFMLN